MNPWARASAGRPTGVIGVLDSAPHGIRVLRGRCGPDLQGVLQLAAALPAPVHPVAAFLAPTHHRLTRDALPIHGPPEVPAVPANTVLVLQNLELAGPATLAVIDRWVRSPLPVPLLLNSRTAHPSIAGLAAAHGAGAVVNGTTATGGMGALPEDFIALALHVAEQGPVSLELLARALGKTPLRVRAALIQAGLQGAEVERDPDGLLSVSAATQAELSGLEQSDTTPADPLERARLATAIGAWDAAVAMYASSPAGAIEGAAVCWALGDPAEATRRIEAAPNSDERNRAKVALLWDTRAPLGALLEALGTLVEPCATLTRAAAFARSGQVREAGDLLTEPLQTLQGEARIDALHLMAKLPLLGPGSLVVARRFAGEAYQSLPNEDPNRALLIETTARLTLRARNVREAAKQFSKALHQLSPKEQAVPFARAVAGLSRSIDLVGRKEDLLGWLQCAIEANRNQPHGLAWCQAALDILMERIEVDDGHTLSALQRQQMQLASLRADRPDPTPLEDL